MKKYILIILNIISIHACAMEMEVKVEEPIEETENEFIERTKKYYLEKLPFCNRNPKPYHIFFLTAYCPDNILRAEIEKNEDVLPTLRVMDTTKNNKQLYFDRRGDLYGHTNIAISRHGNMFAVVHPISDKFQNSRCDVLQDNMVLSVKNMLSKEIKYFDLPYRFAVSDKHGGIAFNKQSTHVILHGCDYHQMPSGTPLHYLAEKAPHHIIIPLTNDGPNSNIFEKMTQQLTLTQ